LNTFARFPSKGLQNVLHIKTHNNPNLKEFPGSARFPKVQNLVLSYAYHCCQFIPSTFENLVPILRNSIYSEKLNGQTPILV
jgi:leucine-rich repeat-containing G protein-coupled receptor 6